MKNPPLASRSERPVFEVLGDRYTLLFSAEETGGAYSMFEFFIPQGRGTPPHIHSREDEAFYVLSGAVDFMVDGTVVRAQAGDMLFGPRGVPHNFTGASEEPARVIVTVSPGGFERFFAEIGTLVTDPATPPSPPTPADIEHLMKVAPEFGLTMLV